MAMTDEQVSLRKSIQKNIERTVGITALRRIRKLTDSFEEEERANRHALLWILVVFALVGFLGLMWVVYLQFRKLAAIGFPPGSVWSLVAFAAPFILILGGGVGYLLRRIGRERKRKAPFLEKNGSQEASAK